jgi:hypothetical protein
MTDAEIIGSLCCQLVVTMQHGAGDTVYHVIGYNKHDPSEWDVIESFTSLKDANAAKAEMEAGMVLRIRFASANCRMVQ